MTDIAIIFEDEDLLVLDKPYGITVNISETTKGQVTVADFTAAKLKSQLEEEEDKESDFYKRAGIVHRLDKETSGILLVSKNKNSFENLQLQFKERKVEKSYIALAHGSFTQGEGEINVPVDRLPWNRKRFGVLAGGKEALTKYRVISAYNFKGLNKFSEILTLLELNPKTGRTHQIRVHLKYISHPIFADFLYAGRKVSRYDRNILTRVFLHAARIDFIHPKTGKRVKFESKLPPELEEMLNNLEKVDFGSKN